jgi:excinuclease ABC subunit C
MTPEEYKHIQGSIPHRPGIYKYFDVDGEILYVGKAKDLRKRVSSYFRSRYDTYRIRHLVKRIERIDFTIVESEADALLLENSLIKEHQPRYNIQLKDDKSFPYICIKKERFPRIFMTRRLEKDGSEYLGPYTSVKRTRAILEFIRTIYPIRTCKLDLSEKNINAGKFKVCLEYHMGNCLGPCENLQTEEDYNDSIAGIRHILKGHFGPVKRKLKENIASCAEKLEFERAEEYRKRLLAVEAYQSRSTIVNQKLDDVDAFAIAMEDGLAFVGHMRIMRGTIVQTKTLEIHPHLDESLEEVLEFAVRSILEEQSSASREIFLPFSIDESISEIPMSVPQRGDKKRLVDLAHRNAKHALSELLLKKQAAAEKKQKNQVLEITKKDFRLQELPVHIECFDNSNLQGSNPVASVVVFRNGKPSKADYRHFNIKTVTGPDDFASMREIVFRRYRRLMSEEEDLPQLIIIDGGKGQLSSAVSALDELGIRDQVTVVGIAKKLEEIYFPEDPLPLHIDKRSPSLKLTQQLRNEAHRFAISFHRQKRSNASLKSELDNIPGIGDKSKEALLKEFRSVKGVREATFREVKAVIGNAKARILFSHFEKEEE